MSAASERSSNRTPRSPDQAKASTTAAAHISPLVDFADLDGHLLVSDDPWEGVRVKDGRLILPDRPGLGLVERRRPA